MKIIDNSQIVQCYKCEGKGKLRTEAVNKKMFQPRRFIVIDCDICNGTGTWIEEHYFYVFKDENGNRIAIDGDQGGK